MVQAQDSGFTEKRQVILANERLEASELNSVSGREPPKRPRMNLVPLVGAERT